MSSKYNAAIEILRKLAEAEQLYHDTSESIGDTLKTAMTADWLHEAGEEARAFLGALADTTTDEVQPC